MAGRIGNPPAPSLAMRRIAPLNIAPFGVALMLMGGLPQRDWRGVGHAFRGETHVKTGFVLSVCGAVRDVDKIIHALRPGLAKGEHPQDLVDAVVVDFSSSKLDVWERVQFDVLFKGDDWQGTAKGDRLEFEMASVGAAVHYFPYTAHTSSSALRQILATR